MEAHIVNVIIPKLKEFIVKHEKFKVAQDYDVISEFRSLMFDISSDEISATIIDAIINGDDIEPIIISEQIKSLFSMLMPEAELSKIEFQDKGGRKNFIDYD